MSTVGPLCPVLLTASWHSILTRVVVFELMCVDSVAVQGKNLKLHVRTWQFVHCKALLWKCEWNHNDVISVVQFKSWNTRILNTATTEQTNRRASDRADRLASNKKKTSNDEQTNRRTSDRADRLASTKKKRPSKVACVSEDLKCWGDWDTICRHKA